MARITYPPKPVLIVIVLGLLIYLLPDSCFRESHGGTRYTVVVKSDINLYGLLLLDIKTINGLSRSDSLIAFVTVQKDSVTTVVITDSLASYFPSTARGGAELDLFGPALLDQYKAKEVYGPDDIWELARDIRHIELEERRK